MSQDYEIIKYGASMGIRCLTCKQTSFHPRHVEQRYCPWCHVYHGHTLRVRDEPVKVVSKGLLDK
jgi:Zn finger protein HypA/HybF involved in hydrogenase expression